MRRLFDGRSRLEIPPPMWKVKREIGRIGRKIDEFILRRSGIALTRMYIKYFVDPKVVTKPGRMVIKDRVAIYMIFPSGGLLKSHLLALDYIADCGYVPIIVSNLPIGAADEATLLAKSAALLVRPNYGYDFAAYRDGLRYLKKQKIAPDYVAIFNDSTWFPARPDSNWFAEAEHMDRDFVGSVFHCAMDPDLKWDFRTDKWTTDPTFPTFHYGSYSLLIGKKALESHQFAQFWEDYIPSNDKIKTIIGGETGLSKMIIASGFSHGATLDNTHLDAELNALPIDKLHDLALNIMIPMYPKLRQDRLEVLAIDPPNRDELRNFILKCIVAQGPGYALTYFDLLNRTGNFVKKSTVALDQNSGDLTLNLLRKLPSPQAAVFADEATAIYAKNHSAAKPD